VTSSIAATFNYQMSATFGGIYNDTPGFFAPSFSVGATAAENPTLSIVPIQGREFTERILVPMDEAKLEFLVFQGSPIDMVLRLMADGIELQTPDGRFDRFVLNSPARPGEYEEFRRLVLQLAWLNANRKLFVSRLFFVETTPVTLSAPPRPTRSGPRWRRTTAGARDRAPGSTSSSVGSAAGWRSPTTTRGR
jgi:hypothetical protein